MELIGPLGTDSGDWEIHDPLDRVANVGVRENMASKMPGSSIRSAAIIINFKLFLS